MKSKIFILFLLVMIVFVSNFALAAELEKNLVLYLSFDELDGKKVEDHSIHGNHGEIAGKPTLVDGKFGKALKLNGKTDWVTVAHDNSLCVSKAVTVMAWINAESHKGAGTARWAGILAKGNNPRSYSFYTTTDGGGALHFSSMGGSVSNKPVELKKWQHVVAQMTEKKAHRYYINGELAGEFAGKGALPGKVDNADVFVGKTHEGNRQFVGTIDEVRIWNRELSAKEVKEQMESGRLKLLGVDPQQKLTSTWGLLKKEK
jgi:hypothetical protein